MARLDNLILSVALVLVGFSTASASYEVSATGPPQGVPSEFALPSVAAPDANLVQLDDVEEEFLSLLNVERAAVGLPALSRYFDLEDDAAAHTAAMIETGDIYHSADLTLVTTGWEALGENVGYGPTVDKLHTAFMNSPHHRDNVVGEYDRVGISADRNPSGVIFVTFIFMRTAVPSPVTLIPETAGPAAGIAGALWLGEQ